MDEQLIWTMEYQDKRNVHKTLSIPPPVVSDPVKALLQWRTKVVTGKESLETLKSTIPYPQNSALYIRISNKLDIKISCVNKILDQIDEMLADHGILT